MSRKAASKDKPTGRGGKREGAGRKPKHGVPAETSSINLPPQAWEMLDRVRGTLSRSEWVLAQILRADIRA